MIDPIKWCASSAALLPDGSLIVAERLHTQEAGSLNRILHVLPDGTFTEILSLSFSPFAVEADPADGSFWVSGARLAHYDSKGILIKELNLGGTAKFISLDAADGSLWVSTSRGEIIHLRRSGEELLRLTGFSKIAYIAVAR